MAQNCIGTDFVSSVIEYYSIKSMYYENFFDNHD